MKEVGLVALHSPKNINITELESHGVRTSLLPWKAEQQYCANAVSLFPCIVQFSSGWYVCPYVLHPISEVFPTLPLKWFQCLIDDGPLLSFQGRLSSTSSFNASLLQAIKGVISLALCPQVVSRASQHFRSSEKQAT